MANSAGRGRLAPGVGVMLRASRSNRDLVARRNLPSPAPRGHPPPEGGGARRGFSSGRPDSYLSLSRVRMFVYKRILRPQTVGSRLFGKVGLMLRRHPRSDYAGVTAGVAAFRPGSDSGVFCWPIRVDVAIW